MNRLGTIVCCAALICITRSLNVPPAFADEPKGAVASDEKNVPVTEVEVKAEKAREGSAEAGYRAENTTATGPWGEKKLQELPYSVNVVSSDLIDNRIVSSTDQIFATNPMIQLNLNQSRGYGSIIYMRGLRLSSGFTELNGMRLSGDLIMPVEDKERVETLSGLSGFLYGPGAVGGLVNYVTKRPTQKQFTDVTIGDYGGSQYFAHLDAGGPIDKQGKIGYRLNLVGSDGDTEIQYNHIQKWLASGAMDFHVTNDLLVQLHYSHQHYYETGTQADWGSWNGTIPHFDPGMLDPGKNYSQQWTYNKNDMDIVGTNLTYTVTPNLKIRTAYQFTRIVDENAYTGNNISYDNGNYTYNLAAIRNAPQEHLNNSGYAFADYSFDVLSVHNKLTVGYYTDAYELHTHKDSFQFLSLGTFNVSSTPTYVSVPAFTNGVQPFYTAQTTWNQNWVIGDEIRVNDQWSMLVGLNYADINTQNFTTTGATSSHYGKSKFTPSASLLYKPLPWLTTYVTYMESLENSGTAATTYSAKPVNNAGQSLAPTLSRQYEVGAKADVGGMLLTTALFEIDKANTYYATNDNGATYSFTRDGEQTNRGIEFTATGKVIPGLTLSAGLVFMDAKITKTNTAYLQDQPPYGAAQSMGKLYAEYAVPHIPKLTLTGGVNYVGNQVGNAFASPATAREWLSSYVTGDVGGRFQTQIYGKETIFRLSVTNVTDERYWQQTEVTGAPRTFAFSATAKF